MAGNNWQERRQHKRYKTRKRIFAVVCANVQQLEKIKSMSKGEIALAVMKSKPACMGEIVEISRNGLSFHHIDNGVDLSQFSEMDILYTDEDFHLSRLPFKTVKETAIEGDVPFDVLSMKRLTVQFEDLTPKQKGQIDHLLEHYTAAKATAIPRKGAANLSKQVWGSRS